MTHTLEAFPTEESYVHPDKVDPIESPLEEDEEYKPELTND